MLARRCDDPVPNVQLPGLCSPALLEKKRSGSGRGPSPGWGGVGWCIAVQLQVGQRGREWPPRAARGGWEAAGAPHSAGAARPSRSWPTRGIAAARIGRTSTGEKNEKKRAGRMSRTRAKSILSGSGSILGGSKLGLGCVLPPKNVGCPRKKTRFLNERWLGCAWPTPKWGPKPSRDSSFFARLRENTVAPGHPQINKKHENQEPSCHRNPEKRAKTWFSCTLPRAKAHQAGSA